MTVGGSEGFVGDDGVLGVDGGDVDVLVIIGGGIGDPGDLGVAFCGADGGRGFGCGEGFLIRHDGDGDVVVEPSGRALSISGSHPIIQGKIESTA